MTVRLPSFWCAASALTSWLMPSSMSPSEQIDVDVVVEQALARRARRGRTGRAPGAPAIAMPTALPRPWPSGPVVVSTPAVCPCSGWPGVSEPHCRSASGRPAPARTRPGTAGCRGSGCECPQDSTNRSRPASRGSRRVVPHHPLEQQVGGGGQAHRGTGVAVAGLLHGVHREYPDRVDRAAVESRTSRECSQTRTLPTRRWLYVSLRGVGPATVPGTADDTRGSGPPDAGRCDRGHRGEARAESSDTARTLCPGGGCRAGGRPLVTSVVTAERTGR